MLLSRSIGLEGFEDPDVLDRAAEQRRVVITHDVSTMPNYAYDRARGGLVMPGVIAIPEALPVGKAIEDLVIVLQVCSAEELENTVLYLPL